MDTSEPFLKLPVAPGTERDRRRRKINWELISCGLRGHALVGTEAIEIRPSDWLVVQVRDGVRWHRCLRCDAWVAVADERPRVLPHPPERGEIEVPIRGKALRDKIVLRVIAIDRALHFTILVLLGVGVLAFAGNERSLRDTYYRILTGLQGGIAGGPVQTSGHVGILREFDKLFSLRSGTLREVGIALLAFGLLEGIQGIGLWYAKRWAEYLAFVATAILLPLEIYEIVHEGSALKVIGFLINLAVVLYLLVAKRLFGLRGGGAADERMRESDMGWPAIERATPPHQGAPAGVAGGAGG